MSFRRLADFPWVQCTIGVAAVLEEVRRVVETRLNATTERAYAIAEGRAKDFIWDRRHIGSTQIA
jgi:hypothetical protein